MTDTNDTQDTRPDTHDDRRTPDDNRYGYGSDAYQPGEGNDAAVTGDTQPTEPTDER
ncbi:hypothetical protein [Deinococcus maricopensis]|uniref:Uncharacterized protein n=1 Tax=Deinococcus maricopensis (strain DSM 21211 / LMG 22137 / NRRL B-23946 / LB-34) TaxID=709986 RepID=E8UBH4_DEIML|nr:hypothetical protein [Deinococcus maricopensis]ADV68413.1 hypothetical protein Deima_2784 [Deinococcus maricopensis DSM 21211]